MTLTPPLRVPVDKDLLADLDWSLEKALTNCVTIDVERNPRSKWSLLLRSRRELAELRRQLRYLYGAMQEAGIPFYDDLMAKKESCVQELEGVSRPNQKYRTNQLPLG